MSSRAFNIADHMKNLQGTRTLASGAKIVGADADSIQAPGLITSAGGGDNTSINSAIGSATGATFNGTIGSSVTFPAGHVINRWHKIMTTQTSASMVTLTTTATTLNLGGTFEITGITATEGNYFLLQTGGWLAAQQNAQTYAIYFEWDIDGTKVGTPMWLNSTNHMTPCNFNQLYTVPASFTNKTIKIMGSDQTDVHGTHQYGTQASGSHPSIPWMLIQEIQG
jgi:hypothetical protein